MKTIHHFHELDNGVQSLLDAARQAGTLSYSPYSGFRVGAAVLLKDDTIVSGFNIENASYPVCMCAEQTTIAAVRTQHPGQGIHAMAIVVNNPAKPVPSPATPCGQCRQLLFEQAQINGTHFPLYLQGDTDEVWFFSSVSELLPDGFGGEFL